MLTTSNLGLIVWDSEEDDFEHSQLADNFVLIDAHSHLGGLSEGLNVKDELPLGGHWTSLGLGLAIKTGAIEPGAIWRYLIKDRAVGPTQIDLEGVESENLAKGSVLNVNLANESVDERVLENGSITADKLDPNVLTLGSVILWYKYSLGAEPGDIWQLCDGTNWASIPNALGLSEGKIPDLREKFARGTSLNKTGETGGNPSINLAHTHSVAASSLEHSHTVASHNHTIAVDGKHSHTFEGGHPLRTRQNAFAAGFGLVVSGQTNLSESLYAAGLQNHDGGLEPPYDWSANMDEAGEHAHGGYTGLSPAMTTGGSSLSGSVTTGAGLEGVSVTPPFVGLCFIMRVR